MWEKRMLAKYRYIMISFYTIKTLYISEKRTPRTIYTKTNSYYLGGGITDGFYCLLLAKLYIHF